MSFFETHRGDYMKSIFSLTILGFALPFLPLFGEETLEKSHLEAFAELPEEEVFAEHNEVEEEGMIYLSVNCVDPEKEEI